MLPDTNALAYYSVEQITKNIYLTEPRWFNQLRKRNRKNELIKGEEDRQSDRDRATVESM
jgi:hypothetical protein